MGTLLVINSNMLFPRKLVAGSPGGIIDYFALIYLRRQNRLDRSYRELPSTTWLYNLQRLSVMRNTIEHLSSKPR